MQCVVVEQLAKMPPKIVQPKDRPKIQNQKMIQDTNNMVKKGILEAWQIGTPYHR